MEEKILDEIKQIRKLLSEMLGTSDLPAKEKFSKEAIAKAAKEHRKLSIERGEWISSHDIKMVIKHAPWNSGKLIVEKFQFTNYFIRGKTYYFNRKDLIELNIELKKKNIDIKTYYELLEDKEKFQKYIDSISKKNGKKLKKPYLIPEGLRDIFSVPYSPSSEELVRNEIETLMAEYQKFNLSEYINLYDNKTYGSVKFEYYLDRYQKPELKKFYNDWAYRFNYANAALKRIKELQKEMPSVKAGSE